MLMLLTSIMGLLIQQPLITPQCSVPHAYVNETVGRKFVYLLVPPLDYTTRELEVMLSPHLEDDWEIEAIRCYSDVDLEDERGLDGPAKDISNSTSSHWVGTWYHLKGGKKYYFAVCMRPIESKSDPADLKFKYLKIIWR